MTARARMWGLFADCRTVDGVRQFVRVADERTCRFAGGTDVVPVVCTEDPEGTWYGWVRPGGEAWAEGLIMVQPHRAAFEIQFPYGSIDNVRKGLGEVVRISVTEAARVEPVGGTP